MLNENFDLQQASYYIKIIQDEMHINIHKLILNHLYKLLDRYKLYNLSK